MSATVEIVPVGTYRRIMRKRRTLITVVIALLAVPSTAAAAPAGQATAIWGQAQEVAGALNQGSFAALASVSCSSAGNCGAGGYYLDGSGGQHAFVVDETNGTWGSAEQVPGALNGGGGTALAAIISVSCASAGNCSAGGYYVDNGGQKQAFVVNETNGTWGTAQEVPGTAALNTGGFAQVNSVSCAAAGDCSAGGYYQTTFSGDQQAFVVTETNGTWGTAQEVPGTAALNTGMAAVTDSVSCRAAGGCSAVGNYADGSHAPHAFVVTETNGTWHTARTIPIGSQAQIGSVSCASVANCSAGGAYVDSSGARQAFVVNKTNGTWAKAKEVPGTATLNTGGVAQVTSLSCASAANCSAGGFYMTSSGSHEAFVVKETNGTWAKAKEVPGTATLNTGGNAAVQSVSCAAPGNCSAGGGYQSSSGQQAFVVTETNGTWDNAKEVPGTATLNAGGDAEVLSVSCAAAGNCGAGGLYNAQPGNDFQAFVVNETTSP